MNLDGAIKRIEEVAETFAQTVRMKGKDCAPACAEGAENYHQLAEWLTELRDIRVVFDEWSDMKIDDDTFCGKVIEILKRGNSDD